MDLEEDFDINEENYKKDESAPFDENNLEHEEPNYIEKPNADSISENQTKMAEDEFPSDQSKILPTCQVCNCDLRVHHIQSELEKYLKLQDAGLDMSFKCPSCRNCRECLKSPGREKLSLLQEADVTVVGWRPELKR